MSLVLVVNAGSSSLKWALLEPETGVRSAAGIVERIGEQDAVIRHEATDEAPQSRTVEPVADHRAAFAAARQRLEDLGSDMPHTVGHRVVHGGDRFTRPAVIDADVIAEIEACVPLAPLHNPPALTGIAAARAEFPDAAHVAVFDTAFHSDIPAPAREYAIDRAVAAEHHIHRYGFHGTSHAYVAGRAAQFMGRALEDVNLVTLHLGNGSSACAVRAGRSVETSMGMTPLEGLVMGSRSGDLDPSVPVMLQRAGWDAERIDDLLNRRGGLKGLCGDNDMREINERADAGDADAELARRVMAHRLRKYLGAYCFTLGHVDAIVFTGGMGENNPWVRDAACEGLSDFGIELDAEANLIRSGEVRSISAPGSRIEILVVPTDEEFAIARQSAELVGEAAGR